MKGRVVFTPKSGPKAGKQLPLVFDTNQMGLEQVTARAVAQTLVALAEQMTGLNYDQLEILEGVQI